MNKLNRKVCRRNTKKDGKSPMNFDVILQKKRYEVDKRRQNVT
jgi:hypothetical protein